MLILQAVDHEDLAKGQTTNIPLSVAQFLDHISTKQFYPKISQLLNLPFGIPCNHLYQNIDGSQSDLPIKYQRYIKQIKKIDGVHVLGLTLCKVFGQ